MEGGGYLDIMALRGRSQEHLYKWTEVRKCCLEDVDEAKVRLGNRLTRIPQLVSFDKTFLFAWGFSGLTKLQQAKRL